MTETPATYTATPLDYTAKCTERQLQGSEELTSKRWKRRELELAHELNTTRQLHRDGKAGADIELATHSLQVKSRQTVPAWLHDAYDQAVNDCQPGKTPAVVLVAEMGQGRKAKRYVILGFDDWVKEIAE